jgi:hypothetical protein
MLVRLRKIDPMNLQLVTFVVGFVIVLGAFITFVAAASARLSAAVPPRIFSAVEAIIIGGILLGTVLMFQPWLLDGFRVGFLLVLFSTLAFILWSHVTPKRSPGSRQGGAGTRAD